MGLSVYAYVSKKEPTSQTSCRQPWKTIGEGPHWGLMEDSGMDQEIQEWDRHWDLHCWFHSLFLEKGGVYHDKTLPFAHPDTVELTFEDLNRLEKVVLNLELPVCDSYLDVKAEGVSLCKTWENLTKEARLKMINKFDKQLFWLKETVDFIDNAQELGSNGQYIYVFSSY